MRFKVLHKKEYVGVVDRIKDYQSQLGRIQDLHKVDKSNSDLQIKECEARVQLKKWIKIEESVFK